MSNPKKTTGLSAQPDKPLLRVKQYGTSGEWLTDDLKSKLEAHNTLVGKAEKAASKAESDTVNGTAAAIRKAIDTRQNAEFDCLTLQLQSIDMLVEIAGQALDILNDHSQDARREMQQAIEDAADRLVEMGAPRTSAVMFVRGNRLHSTADAFSKAAKLETLSVSWQNEVFRVKRLRRDLARERDAIRGNLGG